MWVYLVAVGAATTDEIVVGEARSTFAVQCNSVDGSYTFFADRSDDV